MILFAPVVLMIVAVQAMPKFSDAPLAVALFFGTASGVLCGIRLGRWLGKSLESRIGSGDPAFSHNGGGLRRHELLRLPR
jgi:hypothetical protein